eukprot:TRINITY_DN1450_c0_g1_i3.p1 TRINITY_DN1450_c0_g1~~TRINITY_DN1450_c0_g1_i3.p1  ORF type:complete len:160 (-),score=65.37 TRINITY_DN1450_c0_g1_i3:930-1409(-)
MNSAAKPPGVATAAAAHTPWAGQQQAAVAAQRQRTIQQRMENEITSMVENFNNMVKASKVNDTVRNSQEAYQIEVHSAKVVHAADSLLKLVGELKQSAMFADFASQNQCRRERVEEMLRLEVEGERALVQAGEAAATELQMLEETFYASRSSSSCVNAS